jgi:hypothetical protein
MEFKGFNEIYDTNEINFGDKNQNNENVNEFMKEFETPISKIEKNLYLGNVKAVKDVNILKEKKIKNIVQLFPVDYNEDEDYYKVKKFYN